MSPHFGLNCQQHWGKGDCAIAGLRELFMHHLGQAVSLAKPVGKRSSTNVTFS